MFELDKNVIDIYFAKTLRKIKSLERYKTEYTIIQQIKKQYLNSLQKYVTYYTINIECNRIQQEIKTLDSQLADMDVKLKLLKKEL